MSKPVPMSPELQRLLGRTMTDLTFRAELLRDPAGVLRAANLGVDDDQLALLVLQVEQRGDELHTTSETAEFKQLW